MINPTLPYPPAPSSTACAPTVGSAGSPSMNGFNSISMSMVTLPSDSYATTSAVNAAVNANSVSAGQPRPFLANPLDDSMSFAGYSMIPGAQPGASISGALASSFASMSVARGPGGSMFSSMQLPTAKGGPAASIAAHGCGAAGGGRASVASPSWSVNGPLGPGSICFANSSNVNQACSPGLSTIEHSIQSQLSGASGGGTGGGGGHYPHGSSASTTALAAAPSNASFQQLPAGSIVLVYQDSSASMSSMQITQAPSFQPPPPPQQQQLQPSQQLSGVAPSSQQRPGQQMTFLPNVAAGQPSIQVQQNTSSSSHSPAPSMTVNFPPTALSVQQQQPQQQKVFAMNSFMVPPPPPPSRTGGSQSNGNIAYPAGNQDVTKPNLAFSLSAQGFSMINPTTTTGATSNSSNNNTYSNSNGNGNATHPPPPPPPSAVPLAYANPVQSSQSPQLSSQTIVINRDQSKYAPQQQQYHSPPTQTGVFPPPPTQSVSLPSMPTFVSPPPPPPTSVLTSQLRAQRSPPEQPYTQPRVQVHLQPTHVVQRQPSPPQQTPQPSAAGTATAASSLHATPQPPVPLHREESASKAFPPPPPLLSFPPVHVSVSAPVYSADAFYGQSFTDALSVTAQCAPQSAYSPRHPSTPRQQQQQQQQQQAQLLGALDSAVQAPPTGATSNGGAAGPAITIVPLQFPRAVSNAGGGTTSNPSALTPGNIILESVESIASMQLSGQPSGVMTMTAAAATTPAVTTPMTGVMNVVGIVPSGQRSLSPCAWLTPSTTPRALSPASAVSRETGRTGVSSSPGLLFLGGGGTPVTATTSTAAAAAATATAAAPPAPTKEEGKTYQEDPVPIDRTKNQLIVNFLPKTMKDDEFRALFAQFGPLIEERSHIIYDFRGSRGRKAGNKERRDEATAAAATAADGAERMAEPSSLLMESVKTDNEPHQKATHAPQDSSDDAASESQKAAPKKIPANARSKGYGFIWYVDGASTEAAITELNGLKLGERRIKVRYADQQRTTQPEDPDVGESMGEPPNFGEQSAKGLSTTVEGFPKALDISTSDDEAAAAALALPPPPSSPDEEDEGKEGPRHPFLLSASTRAEAMMQPVDDHPLADTDALQQQSDAAAAFCGNGSNPWERGLELALPRGTLMVGGKDWRRELSPRTSTPSSPAMQDWQSDVGAVGDV